MAFQSTPSGFLNPEEVLRKLDLRPSMNAADFGCGSGGWVIPLAKMLKDGMVYAIDVQKESLSAVRSKMEQGRMFNIRLIESNVELTGSRLREGSCDIVLLTNLLFQSEHPETILKEAKRVLRQGGQVLVVDWYSGHPMSPKKLISPEKAAELAEKEGFSVKETFQAGAHHWGMILTEAV